MVMLFTHPKIFLSSEMADTADQRKQLRVDNLNNMLRTTIRVKPGNEK